LPAHGGGGAGVLLAACRRGTGKVLVIGAGTVGTQAARMAMA